jgi:hypothetical protein
VNERHGLPTKGGTMDWRQVEAVGTGGAGGRHGLEARREGKESRKEMAARRGSGTAGDGDDEDFLLPARKAEKGGTQKKIAAKS